ncbi:hypothetical protein [Deinococcus marmoris]|uniref:Uncharacterized protein n=1 Tax=Deinococcus marmoris TaxID=249408 RepID=A0A1U7P2X7_9DEIO|nr:hypothetical protein [Deinococcus marmoris]OLV19521.1 hypothetical protein BOO71_0002302 [Deinococcus marmoris]
MTIDPRITAILEARKTAGIVITKTLTPASIPATPPARTGGSIGGGFSAQSVGIPAAAPAPTPAPAPVEVPVPDAELAVILTDVISAGEHLVKEVLAAFGDRKLSIMEIADLATQVRNLISLAVGQAAPAIKGTSARDLVILVLPTFIVKYIIPHVPIPAWAPSWLRSKITAGTISGLIKGLEYAYTNWVKPRIGKK